MLITIPYYEWDEVEGTKKKEEEYITKKMRETLIDFKESP
jgi:hypothetical protein